MLILFAMRLRWMQARKTGEHDGPTMTRHP